MPGPRRVGGIRAAGGTAEQKSALQRPQRIRDFIRERQSGLSSSAEGYFSTENEDSSDTAAKKTKKSSTGIVLAVAAGAALIFMMKK
jgi:hypothetical protein